MSQAPQDEYSSQLDERLGLAQAVKESAGAEFVILTLFRPSFRAEVAIIIVHADGHTMLSVRTPRRPLWPFFWKRGGTRPSLLARLLGRVSVETRSLGPDSLAELQRAVAVCRATAPPQDEGWTMLDGMSVTVEIAELPHPAIRFEWPIPGRAAAGTELLRLLVTIADHAARRRASRHGLAGVREYLGP
jgi:hypothetical protein